MAIKSWAITRSQTGDAVLQIQLTDTVEVKVLSRYDLANMAAQATKFMAENELETILGRG